MTSRSDEFYNAAMYIDYENVSRTLMRQYRNVISDGFFDKIRLWAKEKEIRIVKTEVYCNYDIKDFYESHHQSLLQSYGVDSVHTSNQGKNYADLKIAIDVLNEMYTNSNIDEFIIVSNDKDMTPLLNTIKSNKRRVSVITVGNEYNKSLVEFADEHFDYDDIIKVELQTLYIDSIGDRFITNIGNIVAKNIKEFIEDGKSNQNYSKHYSIDYFLPSQAEYYQVMQYELLNIIKKHYIDGKIFLYECMIKTQKKLCILPVNNKDDFIDNDIILETDILYNYDIDALIREKYESYYKNNT